MKLYKVVLLSIALLVSVGCRQSDEVATTAVKAKLAADPAVSALAIDVDTRDGVVTLTANIDDPAAKKRALKLARETPGVEEVEDRITVRSTGRTGDAPDTHRTVGERVDDARITTAVKARLLADPEVQGLEIDVDTRQGVVYLTGTVENAEQREHAIELARGTNDVTQVEPNLEIAKEK